jgi:cytosine/adenosine deaminase-related metal-dependent hydrolase
MGLLFPRPITFIEARIFDPAGPSRSSSIRVARGRVVAVDCLPDPGDTVVDLQGSAVLPGMINAHDHLDLNNFPRLKWKERYANAAEWIADFQPRFNIDPELCSARAVPLRDRLFQGGIKNLLCGATTVCHHDPLYPQLDGEFPVRVVRRFKFSHSLLIDGAGVRAQYRKTPKDWPWIVHAAEGTDESAAREFSQLESWDCVGPNTILVHGVGLGTPEMNLLVERGGALIWCPSSNYFLLGATADIAPLNIARRVALGTDSRLSGEKDLLAELRFAAAHTDLCPAHLLRMVTVDAANLLRLSDVGVLRPGARADLVVFPADYGESIESIIKATRSEIRLVLLGGRAQVGDADMQGVFEATRVVADTVRIDGQTKILAKSLASRLRKSQAPEPGLEL